MALHTSLRTALRTALHTALRTALRTAPRTAPHTIALHTIALRTEALHEALFNPLKPPQRRLQILIITITAMQSLRTQSRT